MKYRCVECGAHCLELYKDFGGNAIRLNKCSQCGQIVDRYVEVDHIYLFLELLLHKEQVFRHLVYNADYLRFFESITLTLRLLVIVLLDTCPRWIIIESTQGLIEPRLVAGLVSSMVSVPGYIIALCMSAYCAWGVSFRATAYVIGLSMYGKLFNALLVTWSTDLRLRFAIQVFVYYSNIVGMRVLSADDAVTKPYCFVFNAVLVRCLLVFVVQYFCFGMSIDLAELFS